MTVEAAANYVLVHVRHAQQITRAVCLPIGFGLGVTAMLFLRPPGLENVWLWAYGIGGIVVGQVAAGLVSRWYLSRRVADWIVFARNQHELDETADSRIAGLVRLGVAIDMARGQS